MSKRRAIEVVADWVGLADPTPMGTLHATPSRGREVFSFEYDPRWLASPSARALDPNLRLLRGPQYPTGRAPNFGVFLDSAPDRWGRVLLDRREALRARREGRPVRPRRESDYLLGVHDGSRIGGLRFRLGAAGPFLDDDDAMAAPPWTTLRALQEASWKLEADDASGHPDYGEWLRLLLGPGSSLGGARPKASVVDDDGALWVAKFPSRADEIDVGAWEFVVHRLARAAGVDVPEARCERFGSGPRTFLSRRFDRTDEGRRVHFASALTLLERSDGDGADEGASYLEIGEVLIQGGAAPGRDLPQLWRRIVFSMCVSNVDDHLRNHGFLLEGAGWRLSPAYDLNPTSWGDGLALNVSDASNAQDLELAREVADWFRLPLPRADAIIEEVRAAVRRWDEEAAALGVPRHERAALAPAFRLA